MPREMVFPESTCTNCGQELEDPKAQSIFWAEKPDGAEVATAYCPNCYFPHILTEPSPPEESGPTEPAGA